MLGARQGCQAVGSDIRQEHSKRRGTQLILLSKSKVIAGTKRTVGKTGARRPQELSSHEESVWGGNDYSVR